MKKMLSLVLITNAALNRVHTLFSDFFEVSSKDSSAM